MLMGQSMIGLLVTGSSSYAAGEQPHRPGFWKRLVYWLRGW